MVIGIDKFQFVDIGKFEFYGGKDKWQFDK